MAVQRYQRLVCCIVLDLNFRLEMPVSRRILKRNVKMLQFVNKNERDSTTELQELDAPGTRSMGPGALLTILPVIRTRVLRMCARYAPDETIN